jgi:amino acid transporter
MSEVKPELRHGTLGFWRTLAVAVGLVVAPSTLYVLCYGFADAGPAFIISMIMAAVIVALFATSMSELATSMPKAGSMGVFAREAFGSTTGIWQGIVYFAVCMGLAGDAMIMGMLMEMFVPVIVWQLWSFIFLAIFYLTNLFGIEIVGWGQLGMTIAMVAILTIGGIVQMSGGGMVPFDLSHYGGFVPAGWMVVLSLGLMSIWLYAMIEVPAPLVEEIKQPSKTIPRAMFAGIGVITVMQIFFGLAVGGSMTAEQIHGVPSPMVEAGKMFFGTPGLVIMAAVTLLAGFTTFQSVMAGTSRVLWGLGRDGYLGRFIGYLHPKYRTPWTTLTIVFVIAIILTLVFESPIWIVSIAAMLFGVTYAANHIYVIVLRHKKPNMVRPFYAGGPFKFPAVPIIGLIGILVVFGFQIFQDLSILYVGGGFVIVAAIIAVLVRRFYARRLA